LFVLLFVYFFNIYGWACYAEKRKWAYCSIKKRARALRAGLKKSKLAVIFQICREKMRKNHKKTQ
jgi:hypothetical protein